MKHGRQRVIFCDFDGTITTNDNIVQIMKHFDPPGWKNIVDDILARRISVRRGVGRLFSLLPSTRREEIVSYVLEQAEIRPGFGEFLAFCRERDIRLLITSGGIDFFVYPILSKFDIPRDDIYCNASDFSGETIQILWPHSCDEHCDNDCGMCKTSIIRSFSSERYEKIVIGDSVTDLAGSRLADWVLARDYLLEKCRELDLPHAPFDTFYDCIDRLSSPVGVK